MHLLIISSTKTILDESNIESVSLPGSQGNFQVLKNHFNIVSQLVPGTITYVYEGQTEKKQLGIENGIVTVHNNNIVVVLD
jgi:F-type H+-transporting ATPase subunit epsilon